MLWWVPPTPVALVLRVEKSKSTHVNQALEATQLRSTCILVKNNPPARTVRVSGSRRLFSHPGNPKMKKKTEENRSQLCCLTESLMAIFDLAYQWEWDADERLVTADGKLRCFVSYPKCCGVAPLTGTVHTTVLPAPKPSSTPPARRVR